MRAGQHSAWSEKLEQGRQARGHGGGL